MSQSSRAFQPDTSSQRTVWVDVAKALCIILVVMMHSTLGLQHAVEAKGFLDPVIAYFAPFRIPTFFILSGLFLERALMRPFGQYVRTRILHFSYFYLLWLAIQIAVRSGSQLIAAPDDAAAAFLFALFEPYASLWFLHLLVVFSLIAFVLRRVNKLIILAAAATLHLVQIETGSSLIDEFAGRGVFFAAGWLMAPAFFAVARRAITRPRLSMAAIGLFILLNGVAVFALGAEREPAVGLVLGIAGAFAMILLSARLAVLPRIGPRLAALGRHSLEIYVAFTLPMAAARSALLGAGIVGSGWISLGVASLVITAVAIIVPLVLARAVRGTMLQFLFVRPDRLAPATGRSERPQPAAPRARRYPMPPPVVGMSR